MNTYDFRSLNDKELESLVVDLLSAEFGVRIERFKPGKDAGVDGRWFITPKREGIIQCKHWLGSGFGALLRHLEKSERQKVDKLKCDRYILVTSLPLSRSDKEAIATAMAPHIVSTSDVFGSEDLNDLIGRHPQIERRHFKLWLSSSNTLALMLNNAIIGRSRAELDQIQSSAKLYVATAAHVLAAAHFQEKRVLVLTGEPGIGKTTLARQLALESVADGFDFVVLEESISEAENVYDEDAKQLFYFDDFLGRTFLQALKPKQDSHILNFMLRVARDPRKRFVLTSRTNILNQGIELSELYSDAQIVRSTYELKVDTLNTIDRARILYNHIWHSELGPAFVDELYCQKRYEQVIKHQNFNPRLVAFVVDAGKLAGYSAAKYWDFVKSTLENPSGVWKHFFSAQLSQDDRDLTYLVVLNGDEIGEAELRDSFFSLRTPVSLNQGLTDSQYWKAIQHVSGSVLTRTFIGRDDKPHYSLYNPSIADYVQVQLSQSGLWPYYFNSLRTVAALTRLEQLKSQPFFGMQAFRGVLETVVKSEADRSHPLDAYNLRLSRLLATDIAFAQERLDAMRRWLSPPLNVNDKFSIMDYSELLKQAIGVVDSDVLVARANELAEYLEQTSVPLDEPSMMSELLATTTRVGAAEAHQAIRTQVIEEWENNVLELVIESGVLSSLFDSDELDQAKSQLVDYVAAQLSDLGVELSSSESEAICDIIDFDDIIAHNIEVSSREHDVLDRQREYPDQDLSESAAIDDLFDRSNL